MNPPGVPGGEARNADAASVSEPSLPPVIDVLIPTYERPAALAVTLAGLASQSVRTFRVTISDQSADPGAFGHGEVLAMTRVLESFGIPVRSHSHRPQRGMAEQRQFLLDQADARFVLFVDDDIWLEPQTLERMLKAIQDARCGFVGSAPIGLSYRDDERPNEQQIELWEGPPKPERVDPGGAAWGRHRVHNAANVWHVQRRFAGSPPRLYKVAWVGGCVLYDRAALLEVGGFGFWRDLPVEHAGEDVLAQLRVMARRGGAALLPSGAYHLELPTTVRDRRVDAPLVLPV